MEWLGATIEFMSFSNGFGVRQPLVSMDFDGYSPLVRRYNGYTFTNTVLVNMFNNMQYQTTFQNEKCQSSVNKHFRKLRAPLIFSLARLSPEVSRGFTNQSISFKKSFISYKKCTNYTLKST